MQKTPSNLFSAASQLIATSVSAGVEVQLATATMLDVYVEIVSQTGTSPTIAFWLDWAPVVAASGGVGLWSPKYSDLRGAGGNAQSDIVATIGGKNITGAAAIGAATGTWTASYKHVAGGLVRLAWNCAGTFSAGQGYTCKAWLSAAA